jgi:GNAT superfamily N-acetyltransferase
MWFEQFEADTDNVSFSLGGRQQVISHLSAAAGRRDLFVWEVKEKPVAMAIMGRTHPKQLLCVYTVPHQRGRGYGQALTAAVCAEQWQATQGREPIILSAVPKFGAARVYERVGFRSAGWLNGVVFEECNDSGPTPKASSEIGDFASFLDLETDFAKLFAASTSPMACL